MPASRHTYSHLHTLPLLFPSRLTPLLCLALSSQAREHPAEKVRALRDTTVDLIKYENLKAYREHIMSEQFQADTIQLVKVDLPALAADKFAIGKESVKATAITMKEEMDKYSAKVASMVPTEEELKAIAEKVKETGAVLLVELQVREEQTTKAHCPFAPLLSLLTPPFLPSLSCCCSCRSSCSSIQPSHNGACTAALS